MSEFTDEERRQFEAWAAPCPVDRGEHRLAEFDKNHPKGTEQERYCRKCGTVQRSVIHLRPEWLDELLDENKRLRARLTDSQEPLMTVGAALNTFDWDGEQGWPMFTGMTVCRAHFAYLRNCAALGVTPDPRGAWSDLREDATADTPPPPTDRRGAARGELAVGQRGQMTRGRDGAPVLSGGRYAPDAFGRPA